VQGRSSGLVYDLGHGTRLEGDFGGLRNEPNLGSRLLFRLGWGGGGNLGCGRFRRFRDCDWAGREAHPTGAFHGLVGGLQAMEFL
jgi:hypothetical protein